MVDVWDFLLARVRGGEAAVLLQVVDHRGSSPGKTGFRMAVGGAAMAGTIGGGMVEHELVERARRRLQGGLGGVELLVREHSETAERDRSGMICSGAQTVALLGLAAADEGALAAAAAAVAGGAAVRLHLSPRGLAVTAAGAEGASGFQARDGGWSYAERLGQSDSLALFGGGHVSLALSRVMAVFDFRLCVFDERAGLDTMAANRWAHEKRVMPFEAATDAVPPGERSWAVIMTFGHQADERVLRRLLAKPLRYLGMLGSPAKVAQLFDRLRRDGFSAEALARVHAPVGLPIGSRTPDEIALSIAAEIIQLRNRGQS